MRMKVKIDFYNDKRMLVGSTVGWLEKEGVFCEEKIEEEKPMEEGVVVDLKPVNYLEDMEFVRIIRNQNRKAFFDSKRIGKKEQKKFFLNKVLKDRVKIWVIRVLIGRVWKDVGYCQRYEAKGRECFVGIALDRKYQNNGYGSKGLAMLVSILKEEGFLAINLEVKKGNEIAIKSYEKAGFIIRKVEKEKIAMSFNWGR
jgi:RimJ/RimL family protein N-acetyltransferase